MIIVDKLMSESLMKEEDDDDDVVPCGPMSSVGLSSVNGGIAGHRSSAHGRSTNGLSVVNSALELHGYSSLHYSEGKGKG